MGRYYVRMHCYRLSGDEDLLEENFNTISEIRVWIDLHSFTDVATKNRVQWRVLYAYDTETKEDITYKFI